MAKSLGQMGIAVLVALAMVGCSSTRMPDRNTSTSQFILQGRLAKVQERYATETYDDFTLNYHFHLAVDASEQEIAAFLLTQGANIDGVLPPEARPYPYHFTPLVIAVNEGNTEMIRWLLDSGAATDVDGAVSPLVAAAIAGDVDVARLLIDAGCDLEFASTLPSDSSETVVVATPIYFARSAAMLRCFVESGARFDGSATVDGRPIPLYDWIASRQPFEHGWPNRRLAAVIAYAKAHPEDPRLERYYARATAETLAEYNRQSSRVD